MMKTKCVSNPHNMPYLTIGNSYEILCDHPTREDFFYLIADYNVSSYYNKSWFESISVPNPVVYVGGSKSSYPVERKGFRNFGGGLILIGSVVTTVGFCINISAPRRLKLNNRNTEVKEYFID